MPNDRRATLGGATYFFTVNTYRRQPFLIDAWVLLPGHMHCIWPLPNGDADFLPVGELLKRRLRNVVASDEITWPGCPVVGSPRDSTLW